MDVQVEGEDDGARAGGGMGRGQVLRAHDGTQAGNAGAARARCDVVPRRIGVLQKPSAMRQRKHKYTAIQQ